MKGWKTMQPVSIEDLGNFMQNILNVFSPYLLWAFTFMMAMYALMGVRRLFVGVKQ